MGTEAGEVTAPSSGPTLFAELREGLELVNHFLKVTQVDIRCLSVR